MPAYSALRRGSKFRKRGSRRRNESLVSDLPSPPNALNIKQQFGLVQGVPLSPSSKKKKKKGKRVFDAARAAMCLLKEEDHVWTIQSCMETINILRTRNNSMKAQLLELDTNFKDHVQARQRRIDDLEKAITSLEQAKHEVEATLETERDERGGRERDLVRQRETETEALESTVKNLTEEVESLQAFSSARDRVRAEIAALKAENQDLRDNQEISLQSLRRELARERASREAEIERSLIAAAQKNRRQVETSFGGEFEHIAKGNVELIRWTEQNNLVFSEVERIRLAATTLRAELDIARGVVDQRSGWKMKYYMKILKRSAELARGSDGGSGGCPHEMKRGQKRRPVTAPAKTPGDGEGRTDELASGATPTKRPPPLPEGGSNPKTLDISASSSVFTLFGEPDKKIVPGDAMARSSRSTGVYQNSSPRYASDPTLSLSHREVDGSCDARRPTNLGRGGQHAPLADNTSVLPQDGGGEISKNAFGKTQQTAQCWQELDTYLSERHPIGGGSRRPVRPETTGGSTRRNSNCTSSNWRSARAPPRPPSVSSVRRRSYRRQEGRRNMKSATASREAPLATAAAGGARDASPHNNNSSSSSSSRVMDHKIARFQASSSSVFDIVSGYRGPDHRHRCDHRPAPCPHRKGSSCFCRCCCCCLPSRPSRGGDVTRSRLGGRNDGLGRCSSEAARAGAESGSSGSSHVQGDRCHPGSGLGPGRVANRR